MWKRSLLLSALLISFGCSGVNGPETARLSPPGENGRHPSGEDVLDEHRGEPVTMTYILHYPITDTVRRPLVVRAPATWNEFTPGLWGDSSDSVAVTQLSIEFVDGDMYMDDAFQGQERSNIFLVSPSIRIVNNGNLEEYFFEGLRLEKDVDYLLVGSFHYREWISPPPLDSPAFIAQSNNPMYWRQTFEFRVRDIVVDPAP